MSPPSGRYTNMEVQLFSDVQVMKERMGKFEEAQTKSSGKLDKLGEFIMNFPDACAAHREKCREEMDEEFQSLETRLLAHYGSAAKTAVDSALASNLPALVDTRLETAVATAAAAKPIPRDRVITLLACGGLLTFAVFELARFAPDAIPVMIRAIMSLFGA